MDFNIFGTALTPLRKAFAASYLKHEFSSAADVRDRLYLTSKEIIEGNLVRFQGFLDRISELVLLKNLPIHVEVRVAKSGEIFPIEFNPMRFAGWCTTDLAYYAYGINVYECFWQQREPDWKHRWDLL